MDSLNTNNHLAVSLLLNDDIYIFKEDIKEQPANNNSAPTFSETNITTPPELTSFTYLGENNKYFLVIVNDPKVEFVNQADLAFLLKILSAIKLELKDIAILNIAHYPNANFNNLKAFFACNKILTFGFNPALLGIQNIKANLICEFNHAKIIGTWSLPQLNEDVNKKGIFWKQLKDF